MSSFAPHICSQSHNREERIVVLFHESKVCFLSQTHDHNFQKQHIYDLTSEFQKVEHKRNYLCRFMSFISLHIILVKAQILNRHNDTSSQWEQCVVNIQNDSLCHSVWLKREMKKTCKWQEMEVNFELHVGPWRCWMSTGRSQWAYLCITVPLFSCYVCDFKSEWDILQQHVSNSDSH